MEYALMFALVFLGMFLRGIQFKNVQHGMMLHSGFISAIIKGFDMAAIGLLVSDFGIVAILVSAVAAGAGTMAAMFVTNRTHKDL